MNTDSYLSELHTINGAIIGDGIGAFRHGETFCVDKFGRDILFSAPQDVAPAMQRLLTVFTAEFAAASDIASLSRALARLYYGLIAIHPFRDGNRRTAFRFMEARAREKSCALRSLFLLQKLLFEGDVVGDLKKLVALFTHMLQPAHATGE